MTFAETHSTSKRSLAKCAQNQWVQSAKAERRGRFAYVDGKVAGRREIQPTHTHSKHTNCSRSGIWPNSAASTQPKAAIKIAIAKCAHTHHFTSVAKMKKKMMKLLRMNNAKLAEVMRARWVATRRFRQETSSSIAISISALCNKRKSCQGHNRSSEAFCAADDCQQK